mmetsp:Transcript_4104/g.4730  ORF Transcript_4104/g.4730 Transcript_4104/m.4730 type:complete len:529 (-) Transcript_4104:149-1735(-)
MKTMETKRKAKIKFLLHAEDGSIPFLTPYLLKKYFSPDNGLIANHLMVGVAVKDTCVIPVYNKKKRKSKEEKQEVSSKRRRVEDENVEKGNNTNNHARNTIINGQEQEENHQELTLFTNKNGNNSFKAKPNSGMKPNGYVFDWPNHKESLGIDGFNLLVVPTFDLLDDLDKHNQKEKINEQNQKDKMKKKEKNNETSQKEKHKKNSKKSANDSSTKATIEVNSSINEVTLCTPHGMQKLSAENYGSILHKLQCPSMIGLYDQVQALDSKRRKTKCIQRTSYWLEKSLAKQKSLNAIEKEGGIQRNMWIPLVCDAINYDDASQTMEDWTNAYTENTIGAEFSGVALVGWHRISSRDVQNTLLEKCKQFLQSSSSKEMSGAVISTKSLRQILDIARYGIEIIGSALPAEWARSTRALALNLSATNSSITPNITDQLDGNGCIDISNQDLYRNDKKVLLTGCKCPACENGKYSRSYIHHLIKAKELLGETILFGHNLYQMLLLCEQLSSTYNDASIEQYCKLIEHQIMQRI